MERVDIIFDYLVFLHKQLITKELRDFLKPRSSTSTIIGAL